MVGAGSSWRRAWAGTQVLALVIALLAAGSGAAAQAAPAVTLVWRTPEGKVFQQIAHAPDGTAPGTTTPAATLKPVPLGSVWKLFVYSYLHASQAQEPPYTCDAQQRREEDTYCCDPGQRISRDTALQRSCGAYFEPRRLGLNAQAWQRFWSARAAPAWLHTLAGLAPSAAAAKTVPVEALLAALHAVPDASRQAARQALLPNSLRDAELLAAVGSSPRFKTWSWFDARGERWGGAAGWLANGSAFWFGAPGTGQTALHTHAHWLGETWQRDSASTRPADAAGQQAQACVEVDFFKRHPLTEVRDAQGHPATPGPLRPLPGGGEYELRFANGVRLKMPGQAGFQLRRETPGSAGAAPDGMDSTEPRAGGTWRIQATLPLEDYVARVLDREADPRETAAAHALAITARTWLRQNAQPTGSGACLQVDDHSRAQRVSPRPASPAAQAAAAFTAGLVLQGQPVRYHLNQPGPNVLSWQQAVQASRSGTRSDSLLRQAFPRASLSGWHDETDCLALPQAGTWLAQRSPRWRRTLQQQVGYEVPQSPPQVCELQQGRPFADLRRNRVYVREWLSRDGRISLIHEYLHLAFQRHPNGRDETFIERLAQHLVDT